MLISLHIRYWFISQKLNALIFDLQNNETSFFVMSTSCLSTGKFITVFLFHEKYKCRDMPSRNGCPMTLKVIWIYGAQFSYLCYDIKKKNISEFCFKLKKSVVSCNSEL